MIEELIKQNAREYLKAQCLKRKDCLVLEMPDHYITDVEQAYIAGATEKINKWHNLKEDTTDVPKGDIHRKILLQDRYGDIYTGNYYPKDDCHPEDCFAVEFLEWGFQGSNFVAFEQIAKWKEIEE